MNAGDNFDQNHQQNTSSGTTNSLLNNANISVNQRNDMSPFMSDKLLLGQSYPYNGNPTSSSADRIPSIRSYTANPGAFNGFSTFQNPALPLYFDHPVSGTMSCEQPSIQSATSYGRPDGYHTLGQMAEQFQERARTDAKFIAKPTTFNSAVAVPASSAHSSTYGDDYDEEDDAEHPVIPPGTEATGRWTRQEHELFLEALKKYGKVLNR